MNNIVIKNIERLYIILKNMILLCWYVDIYNPKDMLNSNLTTNENNKIRNANWSEF